MWLKAKTARGRHLSSSSTIRPLLGCNNVPSKPRAQRFASFYCSCHWPCLSGRRHVREQKSYCANRACFRRLADDSRRVTLSATRLTAIASPRSLHRDRFTAIASPRSLHHDRGTTIALGRCVDHNRVASKSTRSEPTASVEDALFAMICERGGDPVSGEGGYFLPAWLSADEVPAVRKLLELDDAIWIGVALGVLHVQLGRDDLIFFSGDEE